MGKFDVFLCHNSQDKPEVEKIKTSLENKGIKTFYDQSSLRAFQKWEGQIFDSINEARVFLVFISGNGVGRVQAEEIRFFLAHVLPKKSEVYTGLVILPNTQKGIIDTTTNSYTELNKFHYSDLRKDYDPNLNKMISDISSIIM